MARIFVKFSRGKLTFGALLLMLCVAWSLPPFNEAGPVSGSAGEVHSLRIASPVGLTSNDHETSFPFNQTPPISEEKKEREEKEDKNEKEDTREKDDEVSEAFCEFDKFLASLISVKFHYHVFESSGSVVTPLYVLFHTWKHFLA